MSLARAYEKRLELDDADDFRPGSKPAGSSKSVSTSRGSLLGFSSAPTAPKGPSLSTGTIAAAPAPPGSKTPNSKFRRLTTDEMAERRLKGLCFNCPENFSRDHASKCSMKGIYLLELTDEDGSTDSSEEEVEISLHALTGIRMSNTMQLPVAVNGEQMHALVDSGSTHTFIAAKTARRLGLTPANGNTIRVAVANGDKVASSGIFHGLHLRIDQEDFFLDCYVIPLAGFDIVLGVHWLRKLGPIMWDSSSLPCLFGGMIIK